MKPSRWALLVTLFCFDGRAQPAPVATPTPASEVVPVVSEPGSPADAPPQSAPSSARSPLAASAPPVATTSSQKTPPPASATARSAPQGWQLLIPLKVGGDTKGDAEFKLGAGLGLSLDSEWDLSLIGSLRINTSKGLATLFKLTESEVERPAAWEGGLTLSFANVSRGPDFSYDNSPRGYAVSKARAFAACSEVCSSRDQGEAKAFCDLRAMLLKDDRVDWVKRASPVLAPEFICVSNKKALGDAIAVRDQDIVKCAADKICIEHANAALAATREQLLLSCAEECSPASGRVVDQAFCAFPGLPMEAKSTDVAPEEFCPAGLRIWQELEETTRATLRIAPAAVDVGGRLGSQRFSFRTDESGLLQDDDATKVSGAVGISAYNVFGSESQLKPYLEGIVLYESSWTASSKEAKWCEPAGVVARSDEADAPTDPAEACSSATLGDPSNQRTVTAAVYVGLFENYRSAVRAGIGPELTFPLKNESERDFDIGLSEHPKPASCELLKTGQS
jgi:hypothetical protein